jgi:hypothetical protein
MGLIILFAALGLVLCGIAIAMRYVDEWSNYEVFNVFGVCFLIAAIIIGCIAWHESVYSDMITAKWRNKYESLKIQLDNGYYDRITYDGRKALMDDIVEYNGAVIWGRAKHNSEWIGALYQEDWDSLPLIDLGGVAQ